MTSRSQVPHRPVGATLIKYASAAHLRLYRWSGGRAGKKLRIGSAFWHGVPICLLTTTGHRSGRPRTVPLLFMPDGANVVLVASRGGALKQPAWFRNLSAQPNVDIQVGRTSRAMLARTASVAERADLWPRLTELYREFARYQSRTEHEIPVVICEPVPAG